MIGLNKENFEAISKQRKLLVIDFWGQGCMPCVQYSPIFENVAAMVEKDKELSEKVVMVKCNVHDFYELGSSLGIRSIPTTHFSYAQIELNRFSGVANEQQLLSGIKEVLEFIKQNQDKIEKELG